MTKLLGRVTLHGGEKVAETAVVELHNSGGDVIDQVAVDADGRFTYHLAEGTWTLNIWDAHGHRGKVDVALAADEEKTIEVDLEEPEGGH
jgi:hypothetical protein